MATESRGRKPARRGASEKGSPWDSLQQKSAGDSRRDHKSGWRRSAERPARRGRVEQRSYTGKVSAHPDGFGFVDVEGIDKGFFLPVDQMQGLMHGDSVEIRPVRRRGRESAEVVRIVEHAPTVLVGQFLIQGGLGIVEPRSRKMPQSILIKRDDAGGAHHGDWVRIDIERGPGHLHGRVIEVLGEDLSPSKLIDLIIVEQQLADAFPEAVMREVDQFAETVDASDIEGRRDLRHLPFVTIDGEDARDFDDAICVKPRGEGFEAWVAIADVAHYVAPKSALDQEALNRSNSFYFPDRVIPMLPEKLSNGLCSLNPHVDRLAMVVRMRFDANGRRRSIHIYNAAIHSRARLTYSAVAQYLEQGDAAAVKGNMVRGMLDDAHRLFRKLEKVRERRGALDLDTPEARAILKDDKVIDICESPRNVAHRLIEEMMLAANTAVADYFDRREFAVLYRVHTPPEREAIETLNEFLAPFGMFVNLPRAKDKSAHVKPGDVQRVLERSEGKPFAHVLHRLVLRSMQRAQYSPHNEGHFGLAYESYLHFTSPIRRYADLIVHRRLKALIQGNDPNRVQPESSLADIGTQTSTQERKQQRAEWDTQAMLAALFHSKDIGKTVPARISGLTKRRIFFEIEPTMAEGSLDVDSLSGAFMLDEKGHALTARRGGRAYHLGDRLDVVIDSTDPVRGQINLRLAA